MNKKRIKHIVNAIIWPIVAIYFLLVILLQTPAVQGYIGNIASNSLEKKLGTIVSIGKINIGLFNRIIIDDVILKDQNNNNLLKAGRISAKFDIISILEGKISLSSAQLFGLKINAYKTDANTKPNYQFLLDSLASKTEVSHTTNLTQKEAQEVLTSNTSTLTISADILYSTKSQKIQ